MRSLFTSLFLLGATLGSTACTAPADGSTWSNEDCATFEDGDPCPEGFDHCFIAQGCGEAPWTSRPGAYGFSCVDGLARRFDNAAAPDGCGAAEPEPLELSQEECSALVPDDPCPAGFDHCFISFGCGEEPWRTRPGAYGYFCLENATAIGDRRVGAFSNGGPATGDCP